MTIQRVSKVGAAALAAIFIIGMLLIGSTINNIRFGGPLQVDNQTVSDLLADIIAAEDPVSVCRTARHEHLKRHAG